MKIYILRHEDRTQDCSLFAPLTKVGLEKSVKLIEPLKSCRIDTIMSSPFIRTLQTIYPYAKENNIKIQLEYGLSEIHHEDLIPKKAVGISLPEYVAESFNYDPEYKTIIKPTDISYPEKNEQVNKRVKHILKKIILKYYGSDTPILLVTHQTQCSCILSIVNKNSREFANKLDEDTINNYNKGKLCLIFNDEWTYKPIN